MRRKPPIWLVILLDLLLAGLILLIFAFFHHVLPAMQSSSSKKTTETVITESTPEPAEETVQPQETAAPEVTVTPEPTAEPESLKTEWQIKFADHFTDEVVKTDHSYSSPNVSVDIQKVETGEGHDKVTYFVADIYVASIEDFCTYVANDDPSYFSTEDVVEMCNDSDAIVAISGDFCTYQTSGFLVRNGEVLKNDYTYCDICVLYEDGTMACYSKGTYDIDEVLANGALQVWNFGPSLLDSEGNVLSSYSVSTTVAYVNPRSAVGYYEPGHYCFVVVDGRQDGYSKGMFVSELAQVFADLGCKAAYNLDGGGSAVMVFDGAHYSQQSNGGDRDLGDILLVRDVEPSEKYLVKGD